MIINSLINDLLNPDNSFYITRYRNVRPTETIINLTLLENDEHIREKYRQLNMGYIQQIQYWILNGYGHLPATPEKQIDISYVFLCDLIVTVLLIYSYREYGFKANYASYFGFVF